MAFTKAFQGATSGTSADPTPVTEDPGSGGGILSRVRGILRRNS